jgi:hypothetical protein
VDQPSPSTTRWPTRTTSLLVILLLLLAASITLIRW